LLKTSTSDFLKTWGYPNTNKKSFVLEKNKTLRKKRKTEETLAFAINFQKPSTALPK
jgi:hypothetical protein